METILDEELPRSSLANLIFKPINSPDPRIALAKAELEFPELHEPENPAAAHRKDCISLDDFHAYMPNHAYIFVPTREMWPEKSVNARIAPIAMKDARGEPVPDDAGNPKKMTASAWLDRHLRHSRRGPENFGNQIPISGRAMP